MECERGRLGRAFYLRLDEGDDLLECLKRVALDEEVRCAVVLAFGAAHGGRLVVGSREPTAPPEPMYRELAGGYELLAVGTLLRGPDGEPSVHLHGTLARGDEVRAGCLRERVPVYLVAEAVLIELEGLRAVRAFDRHAGVWAPRVGNRDER